jgi:hypothetical protein
MIIASPNFNDGAMIPRKFTCDGGGINPELEIQNVPPGAKSLALMMHDPDAPIAGGFTHWVVWNIDPSTTLIKDESVPPGSIEGKNSANEFGWFAPCPHVGTHHYEFTLYALDATLDLEEGATADQLMSAMQGHIIEETELVGLYVRG